MGKQQPSSLQLDVLRWMAMVRRTRGRYPLYKETAKQFGFSCNCTRRKMERMEAKGLVEKEPGKGGYSITRFGHTFIHEGKPQNGDRRRKQPNLTTHESMRLADQLLWLFGSD